MFGKGEKTVIRKRKYLIAAISVGCLFFGFLAAKFYYAREARPFKFKGMVEYLDPQTGLKFEMPANVALASMFDTEDGKYMVCIEHDPQKMFVCRKSDQKVIADDITVRSRITEVDIRSLPGAEDGLIPSAYEVGVFLHCADGYYYVIAIREGRDVLIKQCDPKTKKAIKQWTTQKRR